MSLCVFLQSKDLRAQTPDHAPRRPQGGADPPMAVRREEDGQEHARLEEPRSELLPRDIGQAAQAPGAVHARSCTKIALSEKRKVLGFV